MLKVCYGPFHPDLEDAFVARLSELAILQRPIAVIAPSRRMAELLQRLAAVEKGLPLLDVHFHTFHSLALAVTEDGRGEGRLIADPVFHDKLVDSLLTRQAAWGPLFGGEGRPRALASALRSSLRDLIDAGVSGEDIEEFFGEELLPQPEERQRLQALLRLGVAYERRLQDLRVLSPAALVREAARRAGSCDLLGRFQEALYYGFYDLTGLQLEFFEAVAARCPVRLYFPFRRGHPAFRFAEPFFEQKLLAHDAEEVPRCSQGRPVLEAALDGLFRPEAVPCPRPLTVISASGARDEAWAVAKEILHLVESEGCAYEDIGVVARTLEPYLGVFADVFRENAIPFGLAGGRPLLRHPLAKCCLNLLTLRQRDFPASVVEDLVASPYFRGPAPAADWRRLIRHLGIQAGWQQWVGKLEPRIRGPVELRAGRAGKESRGREVTQESVQALWRLVSDIARRLSDEASSPWSGRARQARDLLDAYLSPPRDCDPGEAAAWDAVRRSIASLASFDLIGSPCSWRDFLDGLTEKLRRTALESPGGGRGVRVRGAMDARGEGFKVLFLIGLKEGMFPRVVQEDPLLRDRVRAALRHPAGYWIAQKGAGHEEERLLFYLMAAAASERLYCVFPRSDEAGRAQVPSLYLRELCRVAGLDFSDAEAVRHVPRQPAAKLAAIDGSAASPQELALRLALEGLPAKGRLPAGMLDGELLDEVLERASAIGAWGPAGPFDAVIAPPAEFLEGLGRGGLSPSAMDCFAGCPFQFFASRVLGLGEPEPAACRSEVPAVLRGRIYHELLESFYRAAEGSIWTTEQAWQERFAACAATAFAGRGWLEAGVYPVLWQALGSVMTETLRDFLAWDRAEALRTGLRPAFFETRLEGEFRRPRPSALEGFPVHGIADRIDRAPDGRWRVVDYKTRWSRAGTLSRQTLLGGLHQLQVYAELARGPPGQGCLEEACILAIEDSPEATGRERCQRYSAAQLEADRGAFLDLVAAELRQMRAGWFRITPEDGEYGVCSRCPFPMACRKSHGPSRVRAAALAAPDAA